MSGARRDEAFDKLVRDRIPERIAAQGRIPRVERAQGAAYRRYLKRKLLEEAQELLAAEDWDELVDVYEVLRALLVPAGWSWATLQARAAAKRDKRGGFAEGFVLKAVEEPRPCAGDEA